MLHTTWKNYYEPYDFERWKQVLDYARFENGDAAEAYGNLDKLLYKYYRNEKGNKINPNRSFFFKVKILSRTMKELKDAVELDKIKESEKWQKQQEKEESLESKIQREEDLYERASIGLFARKKKFIEGYVPKGVLKYVDAPGTLANVKNWKAKVILSNSGDVKRGTLEDAGYIMVNPKTGEIVPIARSDEHRTGYELMWDFYQKKNLIKGAIKDFVSIFKYRTYIYEEYYNNTIEGFRFWRENGGPNIVVTSYTGNLAGRMDDFISGRTKELKSGQLNSGGEEFINILNQLDNAIISENPMSFDLAESLIDLMREYSFYEIDNDKYLAEIMKTKDNDDYRSLEVLIFGMNGIKNQIHTKLKSIDKNDKFSMFSMSDFIKFFGDTDKAIYELNRIGMNKKSSIFLSFRDRIAQLVPDIKNLERVINFQVNPAEDLWHLRKLRNVILEAMEKAFVAEIPEILKNRAVNKINSLQQIIEKKKLEEMGRERYKERAIKEREEFQRYGFILTQHALDQYNLRFENLSKEQLRQKLIELGLPEKIKQLSANLPETMQGIRHENIKLTDNFYVAVEDKKVTTVLYEKEYYKEKLQREHKAMRISHRDIFANIEEILFPKYLKKVKEKFPNLDNEVARKLADKLMNDEAPEELEKIFGKDKEFSSVLTDWKGE